MCDIDGKFLKSTSQYHHQQTAHSSNGKLYVCEICEITFKTKRDLTVHIYRDKHAQKSFDCDKCSKYYTTRANLKRYIESTHVNKKFCCAICGTGHSTLHFNTLLR